MRKRRRRDRKRCQAARRERANKSIVFANVLELAIEYAGHDCADQDEAVRRIRRSVYKYTDCGCGFSCAPGGEYVTVAGYCEGTDAECSVHELAFPFTLHDWYEALAQADKDGCELWNETHGCEECGPEDMFGNVPINPECEACKGAGQIL